MGFKTFAAGDVLTASDVNTYLMKQTVITCTSATRPTPVTGMLVFETDTGRYVYYNALAWIPIYVPTVAYTPTLTGPVVGSGGTNTANWMVTGNVMQLRGVITFGTSGQTFPTGTFEIALPTGWTTATTAGTDVGICRMRDSSVPATFIGRLQVSASGTLTVLTEDASGTYLKYGTAPSATAPFAAAWASGDSVHWSATLEATPP